MKREIIRLKWDVTYLRKMQKETVFTESDKWWLIENDDFWGKLNDPQVVKVTSNHMKYIFDEAVLK